MRAARLHGARRPRLVVEQVPEPGPPTGSQLLVAVAASSINGTDLGLARGALPVAALRREPLVLGFDVAGVVVATGPAVTAFAPGDRVAALLGHGGGGHAEQALVPQARAARVPEDVALEAAGALPLAGLTALQALHARGRVRAGDRVLVVGAAGGIGSFAVQLAALAGARVTAVAGGDRQSFLRDLGAQEVVDRDELGGAALEGSFDVVLDAPSALGAAAAARVLAPGGVHVSTHPLSPQRVRALATRAVRRDGRRSTAVMTRAHSHDLAHLLHLVRTGRLRVPVDTTVGLDEVARGHERAAGGQVRGKVVVAVA